MLKEYVRSRSSFGHHILGTLPPQVGRFDDSNAVVDSQLRVLGVPNLRVIDTSIYPYSYLHGYNTSRGAYLIGEIGADLVKATNE